VRGCGDGMQESGDVSQGRDEFGEYDNILTIQDK
jgi:hypothetical protein